MRGARVPRVLMLVGWMVVVGVSSAGLAADSASGTISANEADLTVSLKTSPGGVIVVTAEQRPGFGLIDAELVVQDDRVSGPNTAFRYGYPVRGEVSVVLIGVPSTVVAGTAAVYVRTQEEDVVTRRRVDIEIVRREFHSIEIGLNRAMSNLRTSVDPRRARESVALWSLLGTVNQDAVYHGEAFRLPVRNPRTSSVFGERRVFVYSDGSTDRSIHTGVDFAAPRGTVVFAPAAGRVAFAAERLLTGNTIVLEHLPGVYSLYYHLDRIDVTLGDTVRASSVIGTVGATGLVTGAHLHWEVRVGGVPVEPYEFVDRAVLAETGDEPLAKDVPGIRRP